MQGYPLKAAEPRGIPLDNTLLPEYLRQLGYATHLLGKWHVGYHTRKHGPTHRGFDTFFGYYNGYIEYFNHTLFESVSPLLTISLIEVSPAYKLRIGIRVQHF